MPRFFVERESFHGDTVVLSGENARHLAYSLRAKAGDAVFVCDGAGGDFECVIDAFTADSVTCRVVHRAESGAEPEYSAVLCQALPKSDKMDYIIQKAVELGVSHIIPFESANCVAKIKDDARERKTARWRRIAESAAKQCGRGTIPQIDMPTTFERVLDMHGNNLFCYEHGGVPLCSALEGACDGTVNFMIGPEGGFSPAEARAAQDAGWSAVTLGRRILRTETASLYFLSALSYEYDKLSECKRRNLK